MKFINSLLLIFLSIIILCNSGASAINCYSCHWRPDYCNWTVPFVKDEGSSSCLDTLLEIPTEEGVVCYYAFIKENGITRCVWRGAQDSLHKWFDILDAEKGNAKLTFRKCKIELCNDVSNSTLLKSSAVSLLAALAFLSLKNYFIMPFLPVLNKRLFES